MATKTYEVKIGTTELSNLKSFNVQKSDLWADAGRNMAGELKATFIGTFGKLEIEFTYLTESEMSDLLTLLDDDVLSVTWWDSEQADYRTQNFYKSDFTYPYWNKNKEMYAPFTLKLIPFKKLT